MGHFNLLLLTVRFVTNQSKKVNSDFKMCEIQKIIYFIEEIFSMIVSIRRKCDLKHEIIAINQNTLTVENAVAKSRRGEEHSSLSMILT